MNPGYEVERGGEIVKLKFGEQRSEPLVTRMFWALGFHADPTDYSGASEKRMTGGFLQSSTRACPFAPRSPFFGSSRFIR